jgi:hypothetical protein
MSALQILIAATNGCCLLAHHYLLPPSLPAEKATARQNQAGQSAPSMGDRGRRGATVDEKKRALRPSLRGDQLIDKGASSQANSGLYASGAG